MALSLISNTFELYARFYLHTRASVQGIYEYCVFQRFFHTEEGLYTRNVTITFDNHYLKYELTLFLLPANFELDGMTSQKHGLAAKCKMVASIVEFWASFETNFLRIAGTLEAETSVSGKI